MKKIKWRRSIGTGWIVIALFLCVLGLAVTPSCKKTTEAPPAAISITSISPDTAAAGTVVTIHGANFGLNADDNIVKVNGVGVAVLSDTSLADRGSLLRIIIPKKVGTGPVTVINNKTKALFMGPVFHYQPTITVSTLAGGGSPGSPGSGGFADGLGRYALFKNPEGIAIDSSGNLYVGDGGNNRIRKVTPDGTVSTVAGNGTAGFADGRSDTARFNTPNWVALNRQGTLYVADADNIRIRKITPDGMVSTLAGNGTGGSADGPGASAEFLYNLGICVDTAGTIYAADILGAGIRVITADGVVSTVSGYQVSQSPNSYRWRPVSVCSDQQGNIFFGDYNHASILEWSAGFNFTLAGMDSIGFRDGPGVSALFSIFIYGLCADNGGNIYVTDLQNNRIRKIQLNSGLANSNFLHYGFYRNTLVSTLAGSGKAGYADGDAKTAMFNNPEGLAVDAQGNIYVADTGNNCIRKITIE